MELLERRKEQKKKLCAAGHMCECHERCVQFWFPESQKGCFETGEDSEAVENYGKSFVDSLHIKEY